MSKKLELKDYTFAALFTSIIYVLGFVTIPLPFSPVPITGQTLGVMLAGSMLTVRQAALSLGAFLLLGTAGVPFFAGGVGGLGIIAGPRGGYLVGFLFGAIIIALLKGKENNIFRLGLANIIGGIVVIYIFGVIWLSHVMDLTLVKGFAVGALPYLPGDFIKVVIAVAVSAKAGVYLRK
ncbi:MAG: biotin transporter BioY [Thermincola sp.]|jgi:biotin transport system substrate-specific component|nr:biotin transporter BioY [Thermincola sp.]MDT3703732.1 biotin transporter BioY [Thermincola sp.]